jgi:hypothetical protein
VQVRGAVGSLGAAAGPGAAAGGNEGYGFTAAHGPQLWCLAPCEDRSPSPPAHSLHHFLDLALHFGCYLGGARGKLGSAAFAIARDIVKEQLHLGDFADLRLDDTVR